MISTLVFFVCLVTSLMWLFRTRKDAYTVHTITSGYHKGEEVAKFNISWLYKPVLIFLVGLLVSIFQPFKFERIDAGCVGLEVKLSGQSRGVSDYKYQTGWVPYNTWVSQVVELQTYQQHIEYEPQTITMKGGYTTTITPSFNYALIPEAAGDMYINLRLTLKELEQTWLRNAIIGSINDAANKWKVDSLFNYREQFEASIVAECNKRVSKWFRVSQLRSNILPPPVLAKSIEEQTKAIADAKAEMQKALVADAQAKKKIAIAKGDSAALVIGATSRAKAVIEEAKGDAESMRLKQSQITDKYIEYIRASNWDGRYPTTLLGGNSNALLNLK